MQFLQGVNPWATESGLHVQLLTEAGDRPGLDWRPQPQAYRVAVARLRQGLPTGIWPEPLDDPAAALVHAPAPVLAHLLGVVAGLLADFTRGCPLGWVIAQTDSRIDLFLPGDDGPFTVGALELGLLSLPLLDADIATAPEATIERLRRGYRRWRRGAAGLGWSQHTVRLLRAARARNIPVYPMPGGGERLQYGQGHLGRRAFLSLFDSAGSVSNALSHDKLRTHQLLVRFGIPTSRTQPVGTADEAIAHAASIASPVVIKPRHGMKGNGVSVGLTAADEIAAAFDRARAFGQVIVEPCIQGDDYRLLVVGGRLVAASRRIPAHVMGDGCRSVRRLVQARNEERGRWLAFEGMFEPIDFDAEAEQVLAAQDLRSDDVPAAGRRVDLRRTANISRGGSAENVIDLVHPEVHRLAERVAGIIDVPVLGIDLISPDIRRSWREVRAAVIEVNATPGLGPHLVMPDPPEVAPALIDQQFPSPRDGRVPVVLIAQGQDGGSRVGELVNRLSHHGLCAAWAHGRRQGVGLHLAAERDESGPAVDTGLLLDPSVQAGVFSLSLRAVCERGCGLDACSLLLLPALQASARAEGLSTEQALQAAESLGRSARQRVLVDVDDPLGAELAARLPSDRVRRMSPGDGEGTDWWPWVAMELGLIGPPTGAPLRSGWRRTLGAWLGFRAC